MPKLDYLFFYTPCTCIYRVLLCLGSCQTLKSGCSWPKDEKNRQFDEIEIFSYKYDVKLFEQYWMHETLQFENALKLPYKIMNFTFFSFPTWPKG